MWRWRAEELGVYVGLELVEDDVNGAFGGGCRPATGLGGLHEGVLQVGVYVIPCRCKEGISRGLKEGVEDFS